MQNIPITYFFPYVFVPGIVNQIPSIQIQSQNLIPPAQLRIQETLNCSQTKKQSQKYTIQCKYFWIIVEQKGEVLSQKKKGKRNRVLKYTKDEEFVQRQQTCGRNLTSNTLKLYLKQMRLQNTETFEALEKIIQISTPNYSKKEFMKTLNRYLPEKKNYISLKQILELAEGSKTSSEFSKVLRTSLRHFYLKDIYTVDIRSVRTTRQIRLHQIKKGKEFVEELEMLHL